MAVRTADGSVRPEWQAEPGGGRDRGCAREQALAVAPGKLTFSVFGKRSRGMAVEHEAGDRGPQRGVETIAQSPDLAGASPLCSRSPASSAAAPRPAM